MKKLKIYLDTSVISHLQADDVPEKKKLLKSFGMTQKQENLIYIYFRSYTS